jgi:hypothetical protein
MERHFGAYFTSNRDPGEIRAVVVLSWEIAPGLTVQERTIFRIRILGVPMATIITIYGVSEKYKVSMRWLRIVLVVANVDIRTVLPPSYPPIRQTCSRQVRSRQDRTKLWNWRGGKSGLC